MSACTCPACGRQFTSLSTFDRHQDWDYKRRPMLVCRDPGELGMRADRFGRWASAQNRSRLLAHLNSAGLTP